MHAISSLAVIVLAAITQRAAAASCKTHTYGTCADGIVHWYDPDDGQICDPLDCGGGRAPPKTTEPCCAAYSGTAACVTTPSYMPCFKQALATSAATTTPVATSTPTSVAPVQPTSNAPAPVQSSTDSAPQTTAAPSTAASSSPGTSAPAQVSSLSSDAAAAAPSAVTITSVATKSASASQTVKVSSASSSNGTLASNPTGAAGMVQRESAIVYIGLALGLFAGL